MSRLLLSATVAAALATPVAAHHETPGKSHAVATFTIAEQVKAGGKPLAPGTYEVWILDESPDLGAGAPSNAQRVVELYQNGKMVAREVAEVFPATSSEDAAKANEQPAGTSGTSARGLRRAAVEKLRGGEYVRVVINDAGARYLIHLPTAAFSEPAPQPQAPSRIELPPADAGTPQSTQPAK
jgi:hypothetical protein